MAYMRLSTSDGRAFRGTPSERSERPERMRDRRVRCDAMLGGMLMPPSIQTPTNTPREETQRHAENEQSSDQLLGSADQR